MERQKKPWEEMTEEERQAVRESWKHTLPEEYDIFFSNNFINPFFKLEVPGNVYAAGLLDISHLTVSGDIIVDGNIDCGDVTVKGSFIVKGEVDCLDVDVEDLFDCFDVQSWYSPIYASDYVCRYYEEKSS